MKERNCFVLIQNRAEDSIYNNFTGKYYHFSKKYFNQLSKSSNIEFVYYQPPLDRQGEYFGYGKISRVFEDDTRTGFYFAEITEYKQFFRPVPFGDKNINHREFGESYVEEDLVGTITPQLLDEICLDGGILLNFKADAHLIQVLGEQLIESEQVGILELIKNSLDAGASYCDVRIEKVKSLPIIDSTNYKFDQYDGPVIIVEDDGLGMTREIIEDGWLRPATSLKTNVKEKIKREKAKAFAEGKLSYYEAIITQLKNEYKGRIPIGEKGVGRFATHRLGSKLIITTKTLEVDYELVLKIDWEDFNPNEQDTLVDLSSINVSLTRQPVSRDYGERNSGTRLVIYGGRENFIWNEEIIRNINDSINQLNSPNPNPQKIRPPFIAVFSCPQLGQLPTEPLYKEYSPIFSYYGLVNDIGKIEETTIEFKPPKNIPLSPENISYKDYDLKYGNPYWLKNGNPVCGAFYFHFEIWYRDKEWIEGPDSKRLFDYLDDHGGISVYRDNTLILPAEYSSKLDLYGLGKKQSKQAYRLNYRYLVANIEIDQVDNEFLIDTTSREGLVGNRQSHDFVELVKGIINLVEIKYIEFRDKYTSLTKGITRDPVKLNDAVKQQRQLLKNIDENYPIEQDPFSLFHQIVENVSGRKERLINLDSSLKNLKASLELMEEIQDLLKEKAAYGISVAVSVHEIAKITANFYSGISELLKKDVIDKIKLEDLKNASVSLQSELKRLGPLRAIRNEKAVEFPISKSVKFASEVFKRKLEELNITFEFNAEDDFVLFGRYGTMNQVLTNLFDNSVYWIPFGNSSERKIQIKLDKKKRTLNFADNGTGIAEAIRNNLFEPGYSLKVPQSGLGLYICKYYMKAMNGDIYETHNRERLKGLEPGAQFTLDFEKVPSRKEEAK